MKLISLWTTEEGSESLVVEIDEFTDDGLLVDSIKVDLLDYQGRAQIKIVDESQNIEVGDYNLELTVIDEGSYVLLRDDAEEYPIKVPSSRLRLGDFAVRSEASQEEEKPAYTIEFGLRKSLVQRGNSNNNNGYIIKPNGVRIVSLTSDLVGSVASEYTNLGQCTVYLFEGQPEVLGDIFDEEDEEFEAPETEIVAVAPFATSIVADDGTYEICFLNPGSYLAALRCGTEIDDYLQFDNLHIPSAADITPSVQNIEVVANEVVTVNFLSNSDG